MSRRRPEAFRGSVACRAVINRRRRFIVLFFFNDTATTEIYTLSLHDALPILFRRVPGCAENRGKTLKPATCSPRTRIGFRMVAFRAYCAPVGTFAARFVSIMSSLVGVKNISGEITKSTQRNQSVLHWRRHCLLLYEAFLLCPASS